MRSTPIGVVAALVAVTLVGGLREASGSLENPPATAGAAAQQSSARTRHVPLGLDLYMPIPRDNPATPAKVALGRRLFFDPVLSDDGELSCSSCHDPELAFTDGRRVAEGVYGRRGERNAPTLVNRGYGKSFFLDGRAPTLEEQVLVPIEGDNELATGIDEAVERLRADQIYVGEFYRVFGRGPDRAGLAAALASYVRTIVSGNAPVDRFRSGDRDALSELEQEGQRVFRDRATCGACHAGPNFTDEAFHNTGVAWRPDGAKAPLDPGRYAVTGRPADLGAFKTPTLREVALTAPYMHDGSLATLEEVIDFYDGGGRPNPHLDAQVRPLRLSEREKAALAAFLRALSGEIDKGTRR